MKLVKVHGRKSWNNGWEGRRTIDRTIEKKFRQTERKVVEQESEQTPMGFGTLDSVLAKIAVLEDKIARCKSSWDEATREQAEMNRLELIAILPLLY
ncbi:MAG: hypothetical protein KKC50_08170 [Candidatus Omnitrophica bacterium]|nr:hypothetical protein [Candidatus Omnitrophota bacterium]MBU1657422.1 hypothetical protein [Candidatus Omnitrophota bacterium]